MSRAPAPVRLIPATDRVQNRSDASPMRLDRRREARSLEAAAGTLAATYSNGRDRFGVTHLEVLDRSPTGLGVRTRARIEPGMTVTIRPERSTVPWLATVAVHAEAERGEGGTYRVGLRFSVPRAA